MSCARVIAIVCPIQVPCRCKKDGKDTHAIESRKRAKSSGRRSHLVMPQIPKPRQPRPAPQTFLSGIAQGPSLSSNWISAIALVSNQSSIAVDKLHL